MKTPLPYSMAQVIALILEESGAGLAEDAVRLLTRRYTAPAYHGTPEDEVIKTVRGVFDSIARSEG